MVQLKSHNRGYTMASLNRHIFRVTGPLWGESTIAISRGLFFCWQRYFRPVKRCLKNVLMMVSMRYADVIIKWKHYPRNWPFVRGIHRWQVDSSYKGQWRGALMSSVICVLTNVWANNVDAGNMRHYRAQYHVTIMLFTLHDGYPILWLLLAKALLSFLGSNAVASRLANDSAVLTWKLRCHWLMGLRQRWVTVVIQATFTNID